ncbi:MAG: dephospho-CoA kinase [Sulfurospirillaceae bacterium]|nr:dephospho-CoA kinase [Sulfurospirillaceae bacterium]
MIVITGSIASGKSTVCKLLKENGYTIVDADKIARELINPKSIEKLFGAKYIQNNEVDRKALAKLIFSDKAQREKLNQYIHPLIREKIHHDVKKLEQAQIKYVVDIPLYFESGHYDATTVAVVYCPRELQIERLIKRDDLSREEAILRIENQIDIKNKKAMADFVIDNSQDLEHLKHETKRFMEFLDANI